MIGLKSKQDYRYYQILAPTLFSFLSLDYSYDGHVKIGYVILTNRVASD